MIEKVIHEVEFENQYNTVSEKKPEIMPTIEGNYRIARRVYQQLYFDTAELFAEFIRSFSSFELQNMDDDIRANGWGIKNIREVNDSQELMKIFQDFYTVTGRLPLSNSLIVIPDADAAPGEKLNMKHLYDLFKKTSSHGIVSLPFLGLFQYYLGQNDPTLIKNATSELYSNISYLTLNGAREFQFGAVSDLTARLSFLLKQAALGNQKLRDTENQTLAQTINEGRIFEPKTEDTLEEVLKIIDEPHPEHKKSMFPYVEPTLQTADEIDETQKLIEDDFIDLQTKFDQVTDVTTDQLKQKKIENTIDAVTNENNPFNSVDDLLWEDELFNKRDSKETIETSKNILDQVNKISDNILKNMQPIDNETLQELIDDDFIPIDVRTQQELEDDDYIELESDEEPTDAQIDIDLTSDWDSKQTTVADLRIPIAKNLTDINRKLTFTKKIKDKYQRKKIGKRNNNKKNNVSAEWLKKAGYLDAKDQDKINYIFVPPKKVEKTIYPAMQGIL